MERTVETEELSLMDDINRLSLEELEEKYLKNEGSYNRFVTDFSRLFTRRLTYQLRIADQYGTIYQVLKDGLDKFESKQNIDQISRVVDTMAFVRSRYNVEDYKKPDDKYQAHAIFKQTVGEDRLKYMHFSYDDIVKGIAAASKDYDNREDNYEMDLYRQHISAALDTCNDPLEVRRTIESYREKHPFCKRCNDFSFLFFVNYMVNQCPSLVEDDLTKTAEEVMAMSKATTYLDGLNAAEAYDYDRLARYTRKSISAFKKREEKKASLEQNMQRKKLKELFTRNNI